MYHGIEFLSFFFLFLPFHVTCNVTFLVVAPEGLFESLPLVGESLSRFVAG